MLLIFRIVCLALVLSIATAINFNYQLKSLDEQCFNEIVGKSNNKREKNSRYQVTVKGNVSDFQLTVYTAQAMIIQLVNTTEYDKTASGYSQETTTLFMCVLNTNNQPVRFRLSMHHGVDVIYGIRQLEELLIADHKMDSTMVAYKVQSANQSIQLMRVNFKFYHERLLLRRQHHRNIQFLANWCTSIVILCIFATAAYQIIHFKNYLHTKKLI